MKPVNYHHHKKEGLNQSFGQYGWWYVGRAGNGFQASPLANPFPLKNGAGDTERASVVAKYRTWLFKQIRAKNSDVINALTCIAYLSPGLVCYCAPKPCHADVIIKAVNHYYSVLWRIYQGQRKTYVIGAIKVELAQRHNQKISRTGGMAKIVPHHYKNAIKQAREFAEMADKLLKELLL